MQLMRNKSIRTQNADVKWDLIGLSVPQTSISCSPLRTFCSHPRTDRKKKKKTADGVSSSMISDFLFIFFPMCASSAEAALQNSFDLFISFFNPGRV